MQFDVNKDQSILLGVRRDDTDIEGNKFLRVPETNSEMFKEPVSKDGKVSSFTKAAGLEH